MKCYWKKLHEVSQEHEWVFFIFFSTWPCIIEQGVFSWLAWKVGHLLKILTTSCKWKEFLKNFFFNQKAYIFHLYVGLCPCSQVHLFCTEMAQKIFCSVLQCVLTDLRMDMFPLQMQCECSWLQCVWLPVNYFMEHNTQAVVWAISHFLCFIQQFDRQN